MNERYVMANIKLPIRINDDGSTSPLTDYITFELEKCDKLSENITRSNIQEEFIENITRIFNENLGQDPNAVVQQPVEGEHEQVTKQLFVSQQELDKRAKKTSVHNTSFKNKHGQTTRRTVRNYPN